MAYVMPLEDTSSYMSMNSQVAWRTAEKLNAARGRKLRCKPYQFMMSNLHQGELITPSIPGFFPCVSCHPDPVGFLPSLVDLSRGVLLPSCEPYQRK